MRTCTVRWAFRLRIRDVRVAVCTAVRVTGGLVAAAVGFWSPFGRSAEIPDRPGLVGGVGECRKLDGADAGATAGALLGLVAGNLRLRFGDRRRLAEYGIFWRRDAMALVLSLVASYFVPVLVLGIPPADRSCRPRIDARRTSPFPQDRHRGDTDRTRLLVLSSSDRWVLGHFEGPASVGIYSVGYSVAVMGMMANDVVLSSGHRKPYGNTRGIQSSLGFPGRRCAKHHRRLCLHLFGRCRRRRRRHPAADRAGISRRCGDRPFRGRSVLFYGLYHVAASTFLLMHRFSTSYAGGFSAAFSRSAEFVARSIPGPPRCGVDPNDDIRSDRHRRAACSTATVPARAQPASGNRRRCGALAAGYAMSAPGPPIRSAACCLNSRSVFSGLAGLPTACATGLALGPARTRHALSRRLAAPCAASQGMLASNVHPQRTTWRAS